MDTWQALDEERSALADDLATLTDRQWDAQSLCSMWKVRHVVGHLIFGADMTTGPVLTGLIKSGMRLSTSCVIAGISADRLAFPARCRRQRC
jgi:hypothetical protein